MPGTNPPRTWFARRVRFLLIGFVLLGLCGGFGCGSDSTAPTGPAKPDQKRRMPT